MAGVIMTSNHPKALWPGIDAWYGRMYKQHQTQYTDLFETKQSDKAYEEQVMVTGFGVAPVKAQGAGVIYDSEVQGPVTRYTNVAYALGYIVTYEELQDDLYVAVSQTRSGALANSMRQTKERVGAGILNRGFNSSYTGGDGVELFSDSHPNVSGGTYSNVLSTSADLSEAAIEDMVIQISNATDDRGLKIALNSKSLHVSTSNMFEATRILESVYQTGTADNDINAVKAMGSLPMGVKVNNYFTAPNAWFIRTDCPNGLVHFERNEMAFTQDNDFNTMNAMAKAYERYAFGWTDPRGVYGSEG
jgi:hypothetical protein